MSLCLCASENHALCYTILYFVWANYKYYRELRFYPWLNLYIIKLSGIPISSKPRNALSRRWWYHFYNHMSDIIFDQSAHSISARCQALVIWSFRNFCVGLLSRFVEITDEAMIEFVKGKENTNTTMNTAYDVELFNNFIQTSNPDLLGSTSLHELSPHVLNDYLCLTAIFGARKMAPTIDPQVWKVFFKHPEISEQTELRFHNLYRRCI